MTIHYRKLDVHSNKQLVEKVIQLHNRIFNDSSNWSTQLGSKPSLVMFVAFHDSKVVGYKIGYALNEKTFYSWLGGVDTKYRNHGIARMLMEKQHEYLKKNGYKKSSNKNKE
ncbi:hypothetical protein GPDM_12020 [Planococcus donghaensis MPA1U2]|uniref:N-acetyltransferase domain-containing protein n=1 Tax=Planococcus donghaensis MPA1U2 TaxID=933115 RepID=E7RIU2_9BACL|nr:hypothetical protein GPDM_12020 [Planococcus donghaensis MPA1U2]